MQSIQDNTSIAPYRELYMDIAKGIAIILVMIGHSRIASDYDTVGKFLEHSIYSFHMPLFFIINGYFISRTKSLFPYIILRNVKIVLSLFIYFIIKQLLYHQDLDLSLADYLWYFLLDVDYLWFFWALIISSSLVILLRPLKYASGAILLGLAIIAFYCFHHYPINCFNIYIGVIASPFVYLGYLAKELCIFQKKPSYALLILCFTILIVMGFCDKSFDLKYNKIPYGIFSIIATLSGSYLLIQISQMLQRVRWVNSFLAWSGKHVLLLIFIHCLESIFIRSKCPIPSVIEIPMILAICYGVTFILVFIRQSLVNYYKRRRALSA